LRCCVEKLALLTDNPVAARLAPLADHLVNKSVWIIGGDGWAYDIGYGGLDHVLSSGANVKILVLDTEVYSNTGGQSSKSTPMGAVAKFASGGKPIVEKGSRSHGDAIRPRLRRPHRDGCERFSKRSLALREAEAYPGPVAHHRLLALHRSRLPVSTSAWIKPKLAVDSGYWPLFRYDPRQAVNGEGGFKLDSSAPKADLAKFMAGETRFSILRNIAPARAEELAGRAQEQVRRHFGVYQRLAQPPAADPAGRAPAAPPPPPAAPASPPKP
jgi:pyruvate-ferredoxin/flavodoxin oxidoreductase